MSNPHQGPGTLKMAHLNLKAYVTDQLIALMIVYLMKFEILHLALSVFIHSEMTTCDYNMQDIRPKTKVPVGPRLVRKPDVLRCTYDGNLPTTKNPASIM